MTGRDAGVAGQLSEVAALDRDGAGRADGGGFYPVSYTHLTLPTSDLV